MSTEPLNKFREMILARAFQRVPGEHYNTARRQLLERDGSAPVIYELTLPERGDWAEWRDKTFPLMAKYLKAQAVDPESPKPVIVAAFSGNCCYLIEGEKFMEAFKELEGLNSQALHFRVLQWLSG
jgi:hypothetical protein